MAADATVVGASGPDTAAVHNPAARQCLTALHSYFVLVHEYS
jgi:hypothetical protein